MHFDCNVKIVDAMMGTGKSSAAINYINNMDEDEHILYITPYLDEVDRIKSACSSKKFKDPKEIGTKMRGLKELIGAGANIVSTHALFHRFDREAIDMCRAKNYTLIMDEVTDVVEPYEISKEDFEILQNKFVYIEEETGIIKWRNPDDGYNGKFSDEKRLCDLNCLAYYGDCVMMWLFPIEAFNAFRHIYVLTYMFKSQIQRYYYDYYKLPYSYLYVKGDSFENFTFTDNEFEKRVSNYDFRNLIDVLNDDKMNMIGDRRFDLSKSWYARNKNNSAMEQLCKNLQNFFRNKCGTKTSENIWTTFKDFKTDLSGKGYGRAFLPLNTRASNKYKDRVSVAYPVNRFINTGVKSFFIQHGVTVDEDGYALSEMLQFIWRSAIREGGKIKIYIPSIRMRNLLEQWIEDNSYDLEELNEKKVS